MSERPFSPRPGGRKDIAASTTSSAVALDAIGGGQAFVANDGAATGYVRFGSSGVTANAATDFAVLPGQGIILSIGNATHVAAITADGTTTLRIHAGSGN